MVNGSMGRRPQIDYECGKVLHNGTVCRVVLSKHMISVGCTDITLDAAEYLLQEHKKAFPKEREVVLQDSPVPAK